MNAALIPTAVDDALEYGEGFVPAAQAAQG